MTPDTLINTENGRWYAHGGRITDEHRDEFLSLSQVIQNSSNIGIAKVALELGATTMLGYFQDFGFWIEDRGSFSSTPRGVLRSAKSIKPIELMTTAYGYGEYNNASTRLCICHAGKWWKENEAHSCS